VPAELSTQLIENLPANLIANRNRHPLRHPLPDGPYRDRSPSVSIAPNEPSFFTNRGKA